MGKLNGNLRIRILERDHFTCVYCGRKPPTVALEVDHVTPRSRGGRDDATNLVTACRDCNNGKRANEIALPVGVTPQALPSKLGRRMAHLQAIEASWPGSDPIPGHGVSLDGTWRPCRRCNRVPDDQRLYFVWYDGRSGGAYWCTSCAGTYVA